MIRIVFFNVVGYSIDGERMVQVVEEVLNSEEELNYYMNVLNDEDILEIKYL